MKGKWHPINSIIFFIIVLFYTMYATNLVITGISLLSSLIAFLLLHRGEKKGKILLFYLFIGIIIIVTNPLLSDTDSHWISFIRFLIWLTNLLESSTIFDALR